MSTRRRLRILFHCVVTGNGQDREPDDARGRVSGVGCHGAAPGKYCLINGLINYALAKVAYRGSTK